MEKKLLAFTAAYFGIAIALWQVAWLLDRIVPIPDAAVRAIPLVAVLAFPFALGRQSHVGTAHAWPVRPPPAAIALGGLAAVLAIAFLVTLIGPVHACSPEAASDCTDYLAMVGNLRFDATRIQYDVWDGYGTHYFMRLLPPALVGGLMTFGVDADTGFRLVSVAAWLAFAAGLYLVLLRASGDPLQAFAFVLLILGAHRHMTYSLRHVHYAADALTYPLSLGLVVCTMRNRWRPVFVLALLGIITKQNLFALSTLCFAWLFVENRTGRIRVEVAALGAATIVAYGALSVYFEATGTVARHALPAGSDLLAPFRYAFEQNVLGLFLAILPILILAGPETARFLKRYWFIGAYVLVAVAQPMVAFEITGNNFERLALQGVWLVYLSAALVTLRAPSPAVFRWALLAYGFTMFARFAPDVRWLAATAMIALVIGLRARGTSDARTRLTDRSSWAREAA